MSIIKAKRDGSYIYALDGHIAYTWARVFGQKAGYY